jgi:hypothetical protein
MSMETRERKRKLEKLSEDPRRKYVNSKELYRVVRENKGAGTPCVTGRVVSYVLWPRESDGTGMSGTTD